MKLSPPQALLVLVIAALALLATGFAWAYLRVKEIDQSMEGRARLGQMTMQLQVVQNEVAAARQLVSQVGPQPGGDPASLAVARNRLQFADGVLQGLDSQAAAPPFDEADRRSLARLLTLSRQLADNGAMAAPSDTQLAQLQQALGRFAVHLGRMGGTEAMRSAHLRDSFAQGMAAITLGGLLLLGLTAASLALGWRREYAHLRRRVQALAGGPSHKLQREPAGRNFRALASDLEAVEQRLARLQEAALQSIAAAEETAAKLAGYAGKLAGQPSAQSPAADSQPGWDEQVDKLLRGLQGLAAGLQAGHVKLHEIQEMLSLQLPERRHGRAGRADLAPALRSAGEKIEQLLLLCLNLRLSLLHGQAEPSHFAAVAEQLDPLCAEGIDLAQAIAEAGISLQAVEPAADAGAQQKPQPDARPALTALGEGLARQAQAAKAMAQFCGHLRGQVGAKARGAAAADDLAAHAADIPRVIGELQKGLQALRAAAGR